MATSGSWEISWESSYWSSTSNKKYYHWKGNWSKSDNTITLSSMYIWLTYTNSSSGSGTDSITTSGGSAQNVTFYASGYSSGTYGLNNSSFSVGSSDTSYTISCWISGENTGSTTISFDATNVAPSGLSASISEAYANGAKIVASVGSYGYPASTSGRYVEAGVLSTNDYNTSPRWISAEQNVSTTTQTITNDSISTNTRYYYGVYASNTVLASSAVIGSFVTLPAAPVASAFSATSSTATFNITENSSGTASTVQLQYSYKKSSDSSWGSWTNAGSASNKHTTTVSLSSLSETDYDVRVRAVAGSLTSAVQTYSNAFSILPNPAITITGCSFGKMEKYYVTIEAHVVFSGSLSNPYNISLSYYNYAGEETKLDTVTKEVSESTYTFSFAIYAMRYYRQKFTLVAHNTVSNVTVDSAEYSFVLPTMYSTPPSVSYNWDSIRKNLILDVEEQEQSEIITTDGYSIKVKATDSDGTTKTIAGYSSYGHTVEAVKIDLDPEVYNTLSVIKEENVPYGKGSSTPRTISISIPYVIRGRIIGPDGVVKNIVRAKVKDTNGDIHDGNYQHPFVVK